MGIGNNLNIGHTSSELSKTWNALSRILPGDPECDKEMSDVDYAISAALDDLGAAEEKLEIAEETIYNLLSRLHYLDLKNVTPRISVEMWEWTRNNLQGEVDVLDTPKQDCAVALFSDPDDIPLFKIRYPDYL